jgi:hypothetical protein
MPSTSESVDYEVFDYKHFDEKPLDLEAAIQEAKRLRSRDTGGFVYRIAAIDPDRSTFRVEAVSVPRMAEEFRLRMSDRWSRLLSRYRLLTVK